MGALVLAGLETLVLDLILLMVAVGALGGMVAALAGADLWLQGVVFAVTALSMLVAVRPIALKNLKGSTPESQSYLESLAGRELTAHEAITDDGGRVRLDGELWSAQIAAGTPAVQPGDEIRIERVDGASLIVRALPRIDWSGGEDSPAHP